MEIPLIHRPVRCREAALRAKVLNEEEPADYHGQRAYQRDAEEPAPNAEKTSGRGGLGRMAVGRNSGIVSGNTHLEGSN
jgi:hypothetical protein